MRANVYVWYDDELVNRNWRYDLTPVTRYDRIDEIELPDGWSIAEAESTEVFAYDAHGDAWKVSHYGKGNDPLDGHYALVPAGGETKKAVSVLTTRIGEMVR